MAGLVKQAKRNYQHKLLLTSLLHVVGGGKGGRGGGGQGACGSSWMSVDVSDGDVYCTCMLQWCRHSQS